MDHVARCRVFDGAPRSVGFALRQRLIEIGIRKLSGLADRRFFLTPFRERLESLIGAAK